MIRMVFIAVAFVAVTVALVVIQPGIPRSADDGIVPEPVTRAQPVGTAPAPLGVSLPQAVTPQARPLASATSSGFFPAPTGVTRPPAIARADADPMDDREMRQMTWEALSGLNSATGRNTAPGQPGSLLHAIVQRSLEGAPVPVVRPPAVVDGVPQVYVVQPGDSLVTIAERIYGDVNMTGPLYALNQGLLVRPDGLRVGQTLVLPPK